MANSRSAAMRLSRRSTFQHAAAHLVQLDALKQRLEVAFPKALVALALNELEEDRTQLVFTEDLQQQLDRKSVV